MVYKLGVYFIWPNVSVNRLTSLYSLPRFRGDPTLCRQHLLNSMGSHRLLHTGFS